MSLNITTGIVERPHSLLIHGAPATGKSTFASGAPDPIFIDVDSRTSHLNVRRVVPTSWDEILEVFRLVAKGELKAGTIVVDTIDHAEMLLFKALCEEHSVPTIEDVGGGYQKGYVAALSYWRRFAVAMDSVRAKGVSVILLAHSADKGHKNATGEDYSRIEVAIDRRAIGFLSQRVDGVGYASFDTVLVKTKDGRFKARSTGKVTLSFAPSAAVQTKRFARYPEKCELTWAAFTNTNTETK